MVLECARAIGAIYNCPNHKNIVGDLLNINDTENYKIRNFKGATVGADTFGLSMLGDGATIKMVLFNVMVLNGN